MGFLKIHELCKVYGRGENQVAALDHVSLDIKRGEFTAIIGTSGSGKSTLLHAIGCVDVPMCMLRAVISWRFSGDGRLV